DLVKHLRHRLGMTTLTDAVSQVLLRPDHRALDINVRARGFASQIIAVLVFEIRPEQERLVTRWKSRARCAVSNRGSSDRRRSGEATALRGRTTGVEGCDTEGEDDCREERPHHH